jgi:uncharacterized protein (TIGR04255 family)
MVEAHPSVFPESDRVVYSRNPLFEVICQLRFPPILRISAEPPAAFQELIRGDFPLLSEKMPEIPAGVPAPVSLAIAEFLKNAPRQQLIGYEFASPDQRWKVSLTRDFLALSASKYKRWEEFRDCFEKPLRALIKVYNPAFFTRVGLRYENLIRRSVLGLDAAEPWAKLIRPPIAGMLMDGLASNIEESVTQTLIKLPEYNGRVRITHGLARAVDTDEESFLIDSDFFTEEQTLDDATGILAYFNKQSGSLFRWCIEERLHAAMDPVPVEAAA